MRDVTVTHFFFWNYRAAMRECHCEERSNVAIPFIREIATPVCALVRNDIE